MAPPGVSIHAARVTAPAPWAPWRADRSGVDLAPDLARGAAQLSGLDPDAVTLAHSSSSIAGGEGWDAAAVRALSAALPEGTAVTTNGDDCAAALRALDVSRPCLVFPPWFADTALEAGAAHFAARGFAPAAAIRHRPEARWADVPPRDLYGRRMHLAQRLDRLHDQVAAECPDDADGALLVGTGLRCVGLIEALETTLGRPVVTANQAGLWRCLGLAGVTTPVTGYGRLFARPAPARV
jgi:maleate isomerase